MGRVFANDPGDRGSVPGRVIPMTLKMALDASMLKTQQHKVRIEGKEEQSRERSSALPLHFGVVAIEKGAFWSPPNKGRQLYFTYLHKEQVRWVFKNATEITKRIETSVVTSFRLLTDT